MMPSPSVHMCLQIGLVAPRLPTAQITRVLGDLRPFVEVESYDLAAYRAAVDIGMALRNASSLVEGTEGSWVSEALRTVPQQ